MCRFFLLSPLIGLFLLAGCAAPQVKPTPLVKVNVLPLALSDAFEFRKTKTFFNGPGFNPGRDPMVSIQKRRAEFGAVDSLDRAERAGDYFTFWWRAHRKANVTVRLEYRTVNLGDYVQARELYYPDVLGTYQSGFNIIGDDYSDDGRITSWRCVLIEEGKIVALTQSMLW
ncbi:MAG TPA: hypothetical protein VIT21_08535 [Chthoniobacterales bacterium]